MLGLFRSALSLGSSRSALAGPSRAQLAYPLPAGQQARFRGQLAPKKTKYRKSMKGRPSLPTGGSTKGTTLQYGGFGLRLLEQVRLTAAQLTSAQAALKRKIKPVKGAEVHIRVFPDVPVCVKGNETRMGKGKGTFEYWACRVPAGRVVFEIAGGGIREEIAKQALKLAQVKMPVQTEFISAESPRRLGHLTGQDLQRPPAAQKIVRARDLPSPAVQSARARAANAAEAAEEKAAEQNAAPAAQA